ncbi:hypothetical protein ACEWY4_003257 [Coilia grayii]|uniref:Coilin n=1 Tax=Coilia grayii TaxID=363190 RepID=A0ABD1KR79_9TELE
MAASSLNVVRVRLYFDYPPPAVPTCRMCWLLVDLNKCRVVGDLVSVIREKFDYSRKTCLDLFIEDCYLPPSESIYVVRDNDSIRVKAESPPHLNAAESDAPKTRVKKRRREQAENVVEEEQNGTLKKRKETEDKQEAQLDSIKNSKKKKKDKKRKRKEEQASEGLKETAKPASGAAVPKPQPEKSTKRPPQPSTTAANGKPAARKAQETSSDSSDSSDGEPLKRLAQPRHQRQMGSSAGAVSKPGQAAKRKGSSSSSDSDSLQRPPKKLTPVKSLPAKPSSSGAAVNAKPKPPPPLKKTAQSSSSDSSDSSTSAERPPPKRAPARIPPPAPPSHPKAPASAGGSSKKAPAKTAETSTDSDSSSSSERPPAQKPSTTTIPKASSCAPATPKAPSSTPSTSAAQPAAKQATGASVSDSSEEEIELVIRKPVLNGMGLNIAGVVTSSPIVGLGRGRTGSGEGRFARKSRGGVGAGRGNGTPWSKGFRYDYRDEDWRKSRLTDSLINTSLILQNPPEPAPTRDYNTCPLLAAPPAVGQKIAFKLLELTENYSPEVSDYKEGKITGFNVTTNMVELQLLSRPKVPTEPGKFDLVYENPDGSEVVEYAVTQGSQLTERWDTLLEPRLIVENVG